MASPKIEIIRGDDHTITTTFEDTENDLSWSTVYFTVKSINDVKTDDSDAIISKSVSMSTDGTNFWAEFVLTDEDTTPAWLYYYDMQVVYSDGKKSSIPRGYLEILPDNTKA